ncbi:MAG: hypothetical protein KDJ65_36200 [Anaerolineae bacterium]|nr:hypothetical protein [candidate division KSB1 bacterium]MCB0197446.1 hypothetical protein [Anaerolineae bacterium]
MKLIEEGRMRGMLLENAENRPPLNISINNLMRNRGYRKNENNIYGLEKYSAPPQGKNPLQPDDRLIEKGESGHVISFLRCSPPGKDKIPGCTHKFINKGLLYDIDWNISELANWRQQRDAAIKFVDGLEVEINKQGD